MKPSSLLLIGLLCVNANLHAQSANNIPLAKADTGTLIIPGKGIGTLSLGPTNDTLYYGKEPDEETDASMGGKWGVWWYIGEKPEKGGSLSHKPEGIGALHSGVPEPNVREIFTTAEKFRTADGVGVGSQLTDILHKYPDAKRGIDSDQYGHAVGLDHWPHYGEVEFYEDVEHGIGFAIQKSIGICVEVDVIDAGSEAFQWESPIEFLLNAADLDKQEKITPSPSPVELRSPYVGDGQRNDNPLETKTTPEH